MKMELPDTLHETLRLAVKDLELVEQDSDYIVDMTQWHEPDPKLPRDHNYEKGRLNKDAAGIQWDCKVCLAGSIMAKTFEVHPSLELRCGSFPLPIANKLLAIDSIRKGSIGEALFFFYGADEYKRMLDSDGRSALRQLTASTKVPHEYEHNKDKFKKDILEIADKLAQHNL